MAQKQGLSLRYKILILLTFIPALTLAIFLFLALGIFENDKVAYVFESSSSVSKSLAAQVSSDLNSILTSVKPVIQEYLLTNQFSTLSQSLMDVGSPLEVVGVFQWTAGASQKLALLEKIPGYGDTELQKINNMNYLIQEANASDRVFKVPFKDDRVLLVEKVKTPTGILFFVIISHLKNVVEVFHTPGSSDIFLVNRNGDVLFGTDNSEGTNLSARVSSKVLDLLKDQKLKTGTEEVLSNDGAPVLASFSQVNFGDLMIVSLVPKGEALKAVQVLLRKSMIFFLVLISGTIAMGLLASGSLTSALTDLFKATQKVAEGDFGIRVTVKSRDEIGSLATSFNAMAEEVSRLMLETAEKARMQSELKTAQTVQETLFPANEANLQGLNIAGYYEPASECGGDWWHYYQVGSKIFLWIGDATGHGAPAALITSAAKSAATIIERLDVDPSSALNLLNRAIFDVSKGKIMMTFFLGCYDYSSKTFTYANASHEAPYLIHRSEQPLKKKNLVPLNEVNNPRLGQARDTEYKQTTIQLEIGDRLFFYTDGIPDIQNPRLEAWGERLFIKCLLDINESYPPIHESVYRMRETFTIHRKRAPLIDDITFFMAEVAEVLAVAPVDLTPAEEMT